MPMFQKVLTYIVWDYSEQSLQVKTGLSYDDMQCICANRCILIVFSLKFESLWNLCDLFCRRAFRGAKTKQ